MNYLIVFNNFMVFLSFIVNILFLIPFILGIYKYFTQKRYIKKVLSYNNESVQIYQSTYTFNTVEGFIYDYVNYNSLECMDHILSVFDVIGQSFSFTTHIDNASNEICIGGFLANRRVNAYFIKYFSNFKFYVDEKLKNNYEKYPINTQMFVYSKSKTGFKINDTLFLETKQNKTDYAFLVKLTPNDFKNECIKTVHILFGGRAISTVKATEYLKTQYKEIYRKYKSDHYFFAIEINLIDNSFNHQKGIIDLKNIMFDFQ